MFGNAGLGMRGNLQVFVSDGPFFPLLGDFLGFKSLALLPTTFADSSFRFFSAILLLLRGCGIVSGADSLRNKPS
jgi:hypothetical protein